MENEKFLKEVQNMYDSLNHFELNNNILILKDKEQTYSITLNNIELTNLNPSIYLLKPIEIFHTLYMLEILPKTEITENEINFINSYVSKYLEWNDKALELNNNGIQNEELDSLNNALNGLKIPIYLAYDPKHETKPAALLIQDIINNHMQEIEQGRGKQLKLVRMNTNDIPEDEIGFDIAQAGFSTLILIASAITATCMYIAYFILGH